MFLRSNRLAKTKDVEKVLKRGQSFFSPHFVIKFSKAINGARLTVVVSTKVSKSAVKRNRVKRVIRDELRQRIKDFRAGDYVIIVKPAVAKLSSADLRAQITTLLTNLKFIEHV